MTKKPINPALPRRTKIKQFGPLWVQSITATDYRDDTAKTYDLVFVKRRGGFRLNHITLLIDLLTSKEEEVDDITLEHRFNIKLLAKRLLSATDWISNL